jgi:hypothetical protein
MSQRQTIISIAAAHLAYCEGLVTQTQGWLDQANDLYQKALALPEDYTPPEPMVDVQPDPVIEPTPEPLPQIPARRVFDLTPLNNWLAGQGYGNADASWGLRVAGSDTPVFAFGPAGKLDWLFEQVFGAGQMQGLQYDTPTSVSIDSGSLITHLGIRHHGGSQYDEIEGAVV